MFASWTTQICVLDAAGLPTPPPASGTSRPAAVHVRCRLDGPSPPLPERTRSAKPDKAEGGGAAAYFNERLSLALPVGAPLQSSDGVKVHLELIGQQPAKHSGAEPVETVLGSVAVPLKVLEAAALPHVLAGVWEMSSVGPFLGVSRRTAPPPGRLRLQLRLVGGAAHPAQPPPAVFAATAASTAAVPASRGTAGELQLLPRCRVTLNIPDAMLAAPVHPRATADGLFYFRFRWQEEPHWSETRVCAMLPDGSLSVGYSRSVLLPAGAELVRPARSSLHPPLPL